MSLLLVATAVAASPPLGAFRPTPEALAVTVDDLARPSGMVLAAGVWWDLGQDAWVDERAAPSVRRGALTLALSGDLGGGLRLDGSLPVVADRVGDDDGFAVAREPAVLGPAGFRLRWAGGTGPYAAGLALRVEAPSGEVEDSAWAAGPEAAVVVEGRVAALAVQAAWLSGSWDMRVGGELRPVPGAALLGELWLGGPDVGPLGSELRGGLRARFGGGVAAEAGLGVGLVRPPGTPELRAFAGLTLTSPPLHGVRVAEVPAPAGASSRVPLAYDAGVYSPASEAALLGAVDDLRADPTLLLRVDVQVSQRRPDASGLARLRAANIRDWLLSHGAPPERVLVETSVTRGEDRIELVRLRSSGPG